MFKIRILLFAALVRGLLRWDVTGSFDAEANQPPAVATTTCPLPVDWSGSEVGKEPGNGSHGDPYYAVLVGGGSVSTPSEDCYVKLALFRRGFWFMPDAYIQIAASAFTASADLEIGNLACGKVTDDNCVADFGLAYHLPELVSLADDDVSGATLCPGFEGAVPGDGTGVGVENAIWAYLDSSDDFDCGRVWQFEGKLFVVAGTLLTIDDGITLQIARTDCDNIDCTSLTDPEWSTASYEPITTQEPPATEDTAPATEDTAPATEESSSSSDESSSSSEESSSSSEDITTTTAPPVNTQSSTSSTTTEDSTFFAAVGFTLLALLA